MSEYEEDRKWADQFLPEIKRIIGPYLLQVAPIDVDREEATDLIVLQVKDMRIAVRMRKHKYLLKYPHEFTLRSLREYTTGTHTELEKVVAGFANWMFYGFCCEEEKTVFAWRLIDLDVFRRHWKDLGVKSDQTPNGDGTYFRWFDCRTFPAELIIAKGYKGKITERPFPAVSAAPPASMSCTTVS